MKVIQVPYGYYPGAVGGTEIYVHGLAKQLAELGVENVIAAPAPARARYEHDGVPVRRFAVGQNGCRLEDLYGLGDELAAAEFGTILDEEKPEIVHLHAFTMGVSIRLVREATRRGCTVIFNYHTPTVTCVQGTLLAGGRVCRGKLENGRCVQCLGRRWGLPGGFVAGQVPGWFARWLGRFGLQGGMWTALRCRELVNLRHTAARSLFRETSRILAPCYWVEELLIGNDVPPEKIVLCRQGVRHCATQRGTRSGFPGKSPLRAVFLGRMDPAKGLHRLVGVFRGAPDLAATLDIYGVPQDAAGVAYQDRLKAAARGDRRLTFHLPIPAKQVVDVLSGYDVMTVPSQVMETGPLVVLEAFAAGTPVIGSNLGGIAELVRHGLDGLLVAPGSVQGWGEALHRCASEPGLLDGLRGRIRPPRTMWDVAREVHALYESLL